ncbi:MAG: L,D-transpeptidase, partial [Pseudolabrys sp.]
LLNSDIEDLYSRVQVGTRVVVLPGGKPPEVASTAAPASQAPQAQGSQMRSNATGSISSSALPPPPARR